MRQGLLEFGGRHKVQITNGSTVTPYMYVIMCIYIHCSCRSLGDSIKLYWLGISYAVGSTPPVSRQGERGKEESIIAFSV